MSRPPWKEPQVMWRPSAADGSTFLADYVCVEPDTNHSGQFSMIHIFAFKDALEKVDRWEHLSHNDLAVVKVSGSPKRRPNAINLRREIAIQCSVFHPCIVDVITVLSAADVRQFYEEYAIRNAKSYAEAPELKEDSLVLEYCPGGTLDDFLLQAPPTTEAFADRCIAQLFAGVLHLHRLGIIHRDLKLSNILVSTEDGMFHADATHSLLLKIADLGLAKYDNYVDLFNAVEAEEAEWSSIKHQHTRALGTPLYHAPEVVAGHPYGKPVDMWSLGMIVFYILFRKHLFPRTSIEDFKSRQARVQEILDAQFSSVDQTSAIQKYRVLLGGLLQVNPGKRWTVRTIWQECAWITHTMQQSRVLVDRVKEDIASMEPQAIYQSPPRLSTSADMNNLCLKMQEQFQIKEQRPDAPSTVCLVLCANTLLIQKCYAGLQKQTIDAIVSLVERGRIVREHPHIVEIRDIVKAGSTFIQIFVEYCRGEDFPGFLRHVLNGKMPESLFLKFAAQVFSALLHLHSQGLSHGAIAATHLFVTSRNPKLASVKLSELYLFADSSSNTVTAAKDMRDFTTLLVQLQAATDFVDPTTLDEVMTSICVMRDRNLNTVQMYDSAAWLRRFIDAQDQTIREKVHHDLRAFKQLQCREEPTRVTPPPRKATTSAGVESSEGADVYPTASSQLGDSSAISPPTSAPTVGHPTDPENCTTDCSTTTHTATGLGESEMETIDRVAGSERERLSVVDRLDDGNVHPRDQVYNPSDQVIEFYDGGSGVEGATAPPLVLESEPATSGDAASCCMQPASTHLMRIEIQTLTYRKFPLEVDPNETVLDLKGKIHATEQVIPEEQRLVFAGKELMNEGTLMSYAIQKGSTVNLVLRTRPAATPAALPAPLPVAAPAPNVLAKNESRDCGTSIRRGLPRANVSHVALLSSQFRRVLPLQNESSPLILTCLRDVVEPCDRCGSWDDAVRYRALSRTGPVLVCQACLEKIALYEAPPGYEQWGESLSCTIVPVRDAGAATWAAPAGKKLLQHAEHVYLSAHTNWDRAAGRVGRHVRGLFVDAHGVQMGIDGLFRDELLPALTHLHVKVALPGTGNFINSHHLRSMRRLYSLRIHNVVVDSSLSVALSALIKETETLQFLSMSAAGQEVADFAATVQSVAVARNLQLLHIANPPAAPVLVPHAEAKLAVVSVWSVVMSEAACDALATLLHQQRGSLKRIDLSDTDFPGTHAEQVMYSIGEQQTLSQLVLDGANLGPCGMGSSELVRAVGRVMGSLDVLSLANCRLSDDDLLNLRRLPASGQRSLQVLDLTGLRWRRLFSGAQTEFLQQNFRALRLCDHPHSTNAKGGITYVSLGNGCASLVLSALDISNCNMVDLKDLLETKLPNLPNLRALSMRSVGMTNEHCAMLVRALQRNPQQLEALDISHNRLVECGGDELELIELLAAVPCARAVNMSSTMHVEIEDQTSIQLLGLVVRELQMVRELRLAKNFITTEIAFVLAGAAVGMAFLEVLDLSGNRILTVGTTRLQAAVKEMSRIGLTDCVRDVALLV